jgi:hypothetical protein
MSQLESRPAVRAELAANAIQHSVNHDIVKDAYGPASLAEAAKVNGLVRYSNSPEGGYAEVANYLNEHNNDSKLTRSLVHNLGKLDGQILTDLSVVYEKHQLTEDSDGLAKRNPSWDNAMAQGLERADLSGYARTFDLGKDCPFASRDVTTDDVNAKLRDMHYDGKYTAMHKAHHARVAHMGRALHQTVDSDRVKFEGLSQMIDSRNLNDPAQAARDILADDCTGLLKTPHGIILHLTPIQRDALEAVQSDYEIRASLYPDLYNRNEHEYSNNPDELVIPRYPDLVIERMWRKMTNRPQEHY